MQRHFRPQRRSAWMFTLSMGNDACLLIIWRHILGRENLWLNEGGGATHAKLVVTQSDAIFWRFCNKDFLHLLILQRIHGKFAGSPAFWRCAASQPPSTTSAWRSPASTVHPSISHAANSRICPPSGAGRASAVPTPSSPTP